MTPQILFSLLIAFFSLTALHAQTLDETKSVVNFSVSNLGINTVNGTFTGMKGVVKFDPANPAQSRFETSVSAATIHTGNEERDAHLKNEDFFEVEKYPIIRFQSQNIKKSGTGYEVSGTLTIKDVSQQVAIPFSVKKSGSETTLTGNLKVNRKEYGLGSSYGSFMIGSEIKVQIVCVVR